MSRLVADVDISEPASRGSDLVAVPADAARATEAALAWLTDEQGRSSTLETGGPEQLKAWVEQPLLSLEPLLLDRRAVVGLGAVRRRLYRELTGLTLEVAPLSGRPDAARWWFERGGSRVRSVEGPAASDLGAAPRGPVEIDRVLVFLGFRHSSHPRPGDLTEPALELLTNGWSVEDRHLMGTDWSPNPVRPSTFVLLAWLYQADQELREVGDSARAARAARHAEHLLAQFAPGGLLYEPEPASQPLADRPGEDQTALLAAAAAGRAIADARRRTAAQRPQPRRTMLTILGSTAGILLWLAGTWGADPNAMTDLGLLSIIRGPAFAGVLVLILCVSLELARRRPAAWRLGLPLVTLIGLLHGTPAVLYGTLRYSWAWKHLGILDYIHRHGTVDPSLSSLGVYHNWPGFFAGTSAFTDLFGLSTGIQFARWWPVVANLAVIPILLYLYQGLWGGQNRREAWLAVLFFTVANWIGQDYFSPQSLGFLLYLIVIGVVLHHFRVAPAAGSDAGAAEPRHRRPVWPAVVVLASSAVIISSHQITPFMLIVSLAALTAARQTRTAWLTVAVTAMAVVWSLTGAWHYMRGNVASLLASVGQPVGNADQNLVNQGRLSAEQVAVSTMGRATVLLIAAAAGLGVLGLLRRRSTDNAGLILLIAPATLVFANSFGGEIGFRTYLFALPLLSWYAARAVWLVGSGARSAVGRSAAVRAGVSTLVALLLFTGFCFGYYGKDRWYYFSHDEVAASGQVLANARPNSLLVTVTANYPGQWKNYERLVYVPIATEPADSRTRLLADPAGVLHGWLSDPRYSDAYILLTRSQEREVDALGVLPRGSYARIRDALARSPLFRAAYQSPEAQVYVLARR